MRGFRVEDPSKVIDNYEMFEILNKGFTEMDLLNTTYGVTIVNVTT